MYVFWVILLVATISLAYRWRCREELWAALLVLVLSIANPLTDRRAFGPGGVEWIGVTEDIILLAQLSYFAIYRRLWWAIFAAGFQSLAIFIHAVRLTDLEIGRGAYIAAYQKYGYFVVSSILYGIWTRGRPAPTRT